MKAVRSSDIDLEQLKTAIKQSYYELGEDLGQMVKDESGCVCVTETATAQFF
jgi:hypothetical protein